MGLLTSLAKSCNSFAIEWSDMECTKTSATSANIATFLNFETLMSEGFCQSILDDAVQTLRASKLSTPKQFPISVGQYQLVGNSDSTLHVFEEIIKDENEKIVSIFTVVTDLAQENQRLKETSERLDLVLRGTNLGMWDWNPQTNDVVFDERWANMLGVTLSDLTLTLKDWTDRVHPDDIQNCFDDINAHVEGKKAHYENTHRMKHADGSWRYILDRGEVVKRDAHGNPIRFTGTHTDVTALKIAEENAIRALSARNKFFARMSHEIRTPLHGIIGTVDILARRNLTPETRNLVSIINESSELLDRLLNDILDVAKIEDGQLELEINDIDILPVIKKVFKLYGNKAKSKGLSYKFSNNTDKQSLFISSDATRVNQILSNALSNAIKFTEKGFVEIKLEIVGNDLVVSVIDSGSGIEDTERVFEPYAQEGNQYSKIMGTGLGLSIVKNLCERLKIDFTIETAFGKGSIFKFNLGKIIDPVEKNEDKIISTLFKPSLNKYKSTLVVDDNEINLFIAKTILEELFEHVDFVSSGKAAIEQVKKHQNYDLVFMDLNMPEMDGIEASRIIYQLTLEKMPTIVAQTADASEESRVLFAKENVKHVITKPFTKEKILALLKNL